MKRILGRLVHFDLENKAIQDEKQNQGPFHKCHRSGKEAKLKIDAKRCKMDHGEKNLATMKPKVDRGRGS